MRPRIPILILFLLMGAAFMALATRQSVTTLTVTPASVEGGSSTDLTYTATLSAAAPSGGITLTITSSSTAVHVPSSVKIASGEKSATFTATTSAVSTQEVSTVTVSRTGSSATTKVTVDAPHPTRVEISPSSVIGGTSKTVTGTVTIDQAAPSGGVEVALASNNTAAASVPASVEVAAGKTSATFSVKHSAVADAVTVGIKATSGAETAEGSLTVNPPALDSLVLGQSTLVSGGTSKAAVALSGPAPKGGENITLKSSESFATVPAKVAVAEGATEASFTVSTTGVSASSQASISATLGSVTKTQSITVTPAELVSLTFDPAKVVGGQSSTGKVVLNGDAPTGGATVTLRAGGTDLKVPGTVHIGAGGTSATFTVTTTAIPVDFTSTISAVLGSVTKTATLEIDAPGLSALSVTPSTVTGGQGSTGTVTLTGAAPTGGTVIKLSSTASSAKVPGSVTVAAGSTSANFAISTSPVASTASPSIRAALASVTKAATLTVEAPILTALTLNPTSVTGGQPSTGTVALTGNAPSGGIAVTLSSDSTFATVPSSVTIVAGSSTGTFTVTTTTVTTSSTAHISAASGGVKETATLAVTGSSGVNVSLVNHSFTPQNVTATAGATIIWTNNSSFFHTVTSDTGVSGLDSSSQYPGGFGQGSTFSWQVPSTAAHGTVYYYHCQFHGSAGNGSSLGTGMCGSITIQ